MYKLNIVLILAPIGSQQHEMWRRTTRKEKNNWQSLTGEIKKDTTLSPNPIAEIHVTTK